MKNIYKRIIFEFFSFCVKAMTPLELWIYKNNANQRFIRVSEKDWKELDGVRVVATFKEVSRRNDPQRGLVVGLKNDAMNAGKRQFVVLTSDGAYQGPNDKGLEQYAEGTWATSNNICYF